MSDFIKKKTSNKKFYGYTGPVKPEKKSKYIQKKSDKKTFQTLDESDKRIIKKIIKKLSIKEITGLINQKNKISKKEIYNYCLQLKNEK